MKRAQVLGEELAISSKMEKKPKCKQAKHKKGTKQTHAFGQRLKHINKVLCEVKRLQAIFKREMLVCGKHGTLHARES